MSRDEEQFIGRVRASLDAGMEQTPPHIAARLSAARHAALASRKHRQQPLWLPASALAAVLLLAVSVAWFAGLPQEITAPVLAQQQASDFELLVQGDDLELYTDLDFYLWLDKRNSNAG